MGKQRKPHEKTVYDTGYVRTTWFKEYDRGIEKNKLLACDVAKYEKRVACISFLLSPFDFYEMRVTCRNPT